MPKRKSLFCCGSVLNGKSVDESYIVADRKVRDEKRERRLSAADKSSMTVREIRELLCPECQSSKIARLGKTACGAQRYWCKKVGHVFVSSEGRNLFSVKLSLKELLALMRSILSKMT
jgi:transposase-like protein